MLLNPLSARLALCAGLAAAASFFAPAPAPAQVLEDLIEVEVLPGWRTDEGRHMAGFRIRLAPGWKTYWRAPGDAGIPPHVDWTGSENLSGAAFHWPVPEVSWPSGTRTIGYSDQVTLPVELALEDPAAPARMTGRLQLGICEDICVPVELRFDATLPAEPGPRSPDIVAALIDRPMTAEEAGAEVIDCRFEETDIGMIIGVQITLPGDMQSENMVIETADPEVWVGTPSVERSGTNLLVSAAMAHHSDAGIVVDRSRVRTTVLLEDGRAIDIRGCGAG